MSGSLPRVMVTRNFSPALIEKISEECDPIVYPEDREAPRQWILDNIPGCRGALVMLTDRIDRAVIDSAPGLKVISSMSVGYDHIDMAYAKSRGVTVTNTPDVLTEATADLGIALLLDAARRVTEGDRAIRSGLWREKWNPGFMLGRDISGKTLGIVGLGRIGRAVARRAVAFGMKILFTSSHEQQFPDGEQVPFSRLISRSDFIVITASLNSSTRGMFAEEEFRNMKRECILVNISRGAIIDQDALYRALSEKWIAGAALDVYNEEPLPHDSPLLSLENVVMTPHIGSATVETRGSMADLAIANLLTVLRGDEPQTPV